MIGFRFASSSFLLVVLLAQHWWVAVVALERPPSVPRSLKSMAVDLKSRMETLRQERVLSLNATNGTASEQGENSTTIYTTSVECEKCEDVSGDAEAAASGDIVSVALGALFSFLTGGVVTIGNGVSGILDALSIFLGGEDSLVGGILSALANFFDPGNAPVDGNPFITLIIQVLDALNPLKSDAATVVAADESSSFEAAAFDLVQTTVNIVTSLLSGIVTVNVTNQNELAAFTIGALSLVEEIGIFGLGTAVDVTGNLLVKVDTGNSTNSTTVSADAFDAKRIVFHEMSVTKVTSMMDIYGMIKEDVAAGNGTAILAISEKALMTFTPKVNAFLAAADVEQGKQLSLPTFFTSLVTLVAQTLNSIILLISGLITNIIGLLTGVPTDLLMAITQLISNILLGVIQIINAILGIFGFNVVPVSSDALKELAVTVSKLEGPLTLSELAACQAGLEASCPANATDEVIECQLTYLQCINSQ